MSQTRHTVDQTIAKLRRADVELGKGKTVPDVCKVLGVSEQTYLPLASEIWRYVAEQPEPRIWFSFGQNLRLIFLITLPPLNRRKPGRILRMKKRDAG